MKKLEIKLPGSFVDLTRKQLLVVCEMLMAPGKTKEYIQVWALKYFGELTIIKLVRPGIYICRHRWRKVYLSTLDIAYHSRKLSWLCDIPGSFTPLNRLGGNYPVNFTLEGETLKLYLAAENYYQAYIFTEDSTYLRALTAILYSRGMSVDQAETEQHKKKFKRCNAIELFTVFMWYSSIKKLLSYQFSDLFEAANNSGSEQPAAPDMRNHIYNMVRALASCDVTKMNAVLDAECWFSFFELNEKSKEIKELKKKEKS